MQHVPHTAPYTVSITFDGDAMIIEAENRAIQIHPLKEVRASFPKSLLTCAFWRHNTVYNFTGPQGQTAVIGDLQAAYEKAKRLLLRRVLHLAHITGRVDAFAGSGKLLCR